MRRTLPSTVFSLRNSRWAIARLERPSAICASTSRSRAVRSASDEAVAGRPTSREMIVGIEHALAGGDARDRIGEHRDVGDAILEQVADPAREAVEQPQRVGGLEVLREQQHRDLRVLLADRCPRRAGPRR